MKTFAKDLWAKGEYHYPGFGDFIPTITTYLHEDEEERSAIIVVPGGGYMIVSPTEGEIVAKKFYDLGYQTFVVTYTVNHMANVPLYFQPLSDLANAVCYVRKNSKDLGVNPDKIIVCGFSAGGHLTGSLAVHYANENIVLSRKNQGISPRPDAVILSYPVITSGEFAHRGSFENLLGKDASSEGLEFWSLEKQVKKDTPPAFIWQTATDETVPVENSYLYAMALRKADISFEHHVFVRGMHGLSLANIDWATGNYDGFYTVRGLYESGKYLIANERSDEIPEMFKSSMSLDTFEEMANAMQAGMKMYSNPENVDEEIAQWPKMADAFLRKVLNQE